ncbi:MAG: hypothetical protein OEY06_08345 [Gammaproteobacteria bacterium]|nr:hypothetical protein [Gammaproteobacteria bacterium]
MKSILFTLVFYFLFLPTLHADQFEWDEYPDLVKKYQKDKKMHDAIELPENKRQDSLQIIVGPYTQYHINFTLKSCYYVLQGQLGFKSPIECKDLKNAFPELSEVLDRL